MGSGVVVEKLELKGEGKLREKLAVAVKTIQWSYAIFWSISSTQSAGVILEWADGYYNGNIKTRKTVQATELAADDHGGNDEKCLGLQRTQQLRDLFISLSATSAAAAAAADETDPPQHETSTTSTITTKRPGAALLTPEDLTETEWYFLVCMSFVYCLRQGLPGKSLASNKVIWLNNASSADAKVFDRSLLAKSTSIETVVCLPCLGGVLELGVNQKVSEDHGVIDYLKASFSEIPAYPHLSKESNPFDIDRELDKLDFDIIANDLTPMFECDEELTRKILSPTDTSNVPQSFQRPEESFMVEAQDVGSWKLIEDKVTNGFPTSMSYSDSMSQNQTIRDGSRMDSVDYTSEDAHYQSILSTLFKEDSPLVPGPRSTRCNRGSDFVSWETRPGSCGNGKRVSTDAGTSQTILKKALYEVAKMHGRRLHESFEENVRERVRLWPPEIDNTNNALTEKKRRERISEKFSILSSLVPSTGKMDKVSILDNTIEYLKELEKRIEELESAKERGEGEATTRKKHRKADRDSLDAMETENRNQSLSKYSSTDHTITVSVTQKDALIEIRCPCRENLLLNIIETMSSLRLDSHSLESSITDGILSVSMESKLKEYTLESARSIKQALKRIIVKD